MVRVSPVVRALLGAAFFGLTVAVLKGDSAGFRGQLGNLSAPWLLVEFLPASGCRAKITGAAVGLVATVVALLAFYASSSVIVLGHQDLGLVRAFAVEADANRVYFLAGLVTGPVVGAFAAWFGQRYRVFTWPLVGALATCEIAVVALIRDRQLMPPPMYFMWGVDHWDAYLVEMCCGIAILTVSIWRNRQPVR
jgi:hypothetical protein